ncbi:hypothetical protein [Saccharolobus caldissimus]|uniref:Uncharacterized protein n=1 Tax=Saccharolobus caldissimus TaxID=1702097 RepID=A0AAQ4CS60_9CREN|nr:hypothetical protein [Saccharolobus caldissimus]BDB98641.1 hypothetical protein SACC_16580 [Saccharolobus caldissimus]
MIEDKLREIYGIDKFGKNVPEWAEEVKYEFVDYFMGEKLHDAKVWISEYLRVLEEIKERLKINGVLYSKEMKSFLDDPRRHLVKKLFIYYHDLIRGRITVEDFIKKGKQAITSSFNSNMRSIYQSWGLFSLLLLLSERGYVLIYPEHRYIDLDRNGKQKSGIIPPNVVVGNVFNSFSFFLEAPRPISWEDGKDLEKVWKFYSLVRPDMLIYEGIEVDIVDFNGDIPIKRPHYIVEFKELENWWKRWRYLKDYKPLSGNEWRARWLKGLYEGLAEVLGVKEKELPSFSEGETKRVKEYKVIELYKAIYRPKKGMVISRVSVDSTVKEDLGEGIILVDDVRFDYNKLKDIVNELTYTNSVENVDIRELAYKFALSKRDEFMAWLKSQGISLSL